MCIKTSTSPLICYWYEKVYILIIKLGLKHNAYAPCKRFSAVENQLKMLKKCTSRQRSGKSAIRKRFPLQKRRRQIKKQTNNKVLRP